MVTLMLDDVACPQVISPLHRVFGVFRVDPEAVPPGESFRVDFQTMQSSLGRTVGQAIVAVVDSPPAILLREIEGMSYEEIAQTMECPVGTVRSRIFRAREAIDKRISPLL